MSYNEVLERYENNQDDYRLLMMKLSKNNSFEVLIKDYFKKLPETDSLSELFKLMKGEWILEEGPQGNRLYDVKLYDKQISRNCAVLFTIRALSNNLTMEDKKHFYNVYKFIKLILIYLAIEFVIMFVLHLKKIN